MVIATAAAASWQAAAQKKRRLAEMQRKSRGNCSGEVKELSEGQVEIAGTELALSVPEKANGIKRVAGGLLRKTSLNFHRAKLT
jgi:hypothetical protein